MVESRNEGSTYTSKTAKHKGEEERFTGGELDRTGRFVQHNYPDNAYLISVSSGRTISIGRFAFARITFTIEARVIMEDDARAEAYALMQEIVTEVLGREEAALRKEKVEFKKLDVGENLLYARTIRLEYGLTIPLPNCESRKVDVGIAEPVDDDEPIENAIERVQKWVLERLAQKRSEVVADDGEGFDYGF